MGETEADRGEVKWGYEARPGYFSQDHHELDGGGKQTVEAWLWEAVPGEVIGFVRGNLGMVLFSGDDAFKKVAVLSGGEKSRLQLAKLLLDVPFMAEACELMQRWGFSYVTLITWVKRQLGMGMYYRNTTEHALFGIRGSLKTAARNVPTHIMAGRRAHSEKPDEFYEVVERMSPAPRMDVFARKQRDGWFCWGDQLGGGL